MVERHDTIVIGGGQAGLAMSYHLQRHGREHVILERGRIAERWHKERWDSLRYQFINETIELPGFACHGPDPNGFAHYTAIAQFIEDYAVRIAAPVRQGVAVTSLRHDDNGGYVLETTGGVAKARNVIVATGPFQASMIPPAGRDMPRSLYQLHASSYRGPGELPPGAVLVIGSGGSGCQIADELQEAGRNVYLSVSRHKRVPRRYRGRDALWWFDKMGRFEVTIDSFPQRRYPPSTIVTGVNGGYDMNVRRFARDGGRVLGRLLGCSGGHLAAGEDAARILAEADQTYDEFMSAAKSRAKELESSGDLDEDDHHTSAPIAVKIDGARTVDLTAENISSVIWATGYRFDYDWLQVPVLGSQGAPIQHRGVTASHGLYFLGLHWMHTFGSGLLSYVGRDAAYIADHLKHIAKR
jgi:putative flavoprotein involved in K+ transport